jgi:hypothetical protein
MMKTLTLAIAVLFFSFGAGALHAGIPPLDPGEYIYDGPNFLNVDGHSAVTVVDWNNDNKKDLLVGQFTLGYIWLFLNVGTDLNPLFNGGSLIESNGTPITTSYG